MWWRSCLKARDRRANDVTPERTIDGEEHSPLGLSQPVDCSCSRQTVTAGQEGLWEGDHRSTPVVPPG
ncbi:Uncharacterised protein [Actinomyces viscosus]|uniref:Uncharacterized protein n=1 Tax=Actinomyces viscosus TaxID=1656 RepID=A0A3S4VAH8_ACTVI|nr:Uncharacterised protein [Actinomyces viscosus]